MGKTGCRIGRRDCGTHYEIWLISEFEVLHEEVTPSRLSITEETRCPPRVDTYFNHTSIGYRLARGLGLRQLGTDLGVDEEWS